MFNLSISRKSFTSILLHHLASNIDNGVTPIAIGHLPHQKPAISRYKITMLCILARRKLSHNLQSSRLGLWGAVALIGLQILREDRQLGRGTNE
ncbi:Bgt-20174 [Blumeria graminis f. sp. tritici]|uniref:Bgt-20174 n=2 Tax=Blumeria graminis f. sp. tritici TaxID=62690 RepID=A0A9X9MF06_BLUGR|nr:Bgt-20174 [Blumeria graminis f. sp. tritici]